MWDSGTQLTLSWEADCKLLASQTCRDVADKAIRRLICGVVYWYLWTSLVPRLRGYHLVEEADVLQDGTSVTKLIKVKNE